MWRGKFDVEHITDAWFVWFFLCHQRGILILWYVDVKVLSLDFPGTLLAAESCRDVFNFWWHPLARCAGEVTLKSQSGQMDPKGKNLGQGQSVLLSNPRSGKSFANCQRCSGWSYGQAFAIEAALSLMHVHSWLASSIPVIWGGVRRPLQHEKHSIHVLSAWSTQRS